MTPQTMGVLVALMAVGAVGWLMLGIRATAGANDYQRARRRRLRRRK